MFPFDGVIMDDNDDDDDDDNDHDDDDDHDDCMIRTGTYRWNVKFLYPAMY